MRWFLLLLPLVGCTQVFGLDGPARAIDAALPDAEMPDVMVDADTRTCIEKWIDGPVFATPELVLPVSTAEVEWDPSLTRDGLELFFQRANDVYVVTRPTPNAPWSLAAASQFNTPSAETKVTVANDKLRAYVSSSRPNGSGGVDIYRYRRDVVTDPWVLQQAFLENVNTAGNEYDPHLSLDSLRLYLAVPTNTQSVAVATRPDTTMAFSMPVVIAAIDAPSTSEGDPTTTDDERVLVYAASGLNNGSTRRLMYATRTSMNEPFSSGTELTQLNAMIGYGDSDPHVTADGCTLYFRSTRTGGGDIYVTTLL